MIKVLHLQRYNVAMAPYRISNALNLYCEGVQSKAVTGSVMAGFKTDFLFDKQNPAHQKRFDELMDWADIIHIHSTNVHFLCPLEKIWEKPSIIQWHNIGTNQNDVSGYKAQLVVAQRQAKDYPDAYMVPNIIDPYEDTHTPYNDRNNEKAKVFFSHIAKDPRKWGIKGVYQARELLEDLLFNDLCGLDIYNSVNFWELMQLKRLYDIDITDAYIGTYGMSTLESLSQGLACISTMDQELKEMMLYISRDKTSPLPMVQVNEDGIKEAILNLSQNRKLLKETQEYSREWMLNNWNPEHTTKFYLDIYQSVLNNKAPSLCKKLKDIKDD